MSQAWWLAVTKQSTHRQHAPLVYACMLAGSTLSISTCTLPRFRWLQLLAFHHRSTHSSRSWTLLLALIGSQCRRAGRAACYSRSCMCQARM
jgi:hypothetical protein